MKVGLDVLSLMDILILVLKMVRKEMMMMEKVRKMGQELLVDISKMLQGNKYLEKK